MNIIVKYAKLALSDINSAEILYANKLYPQSIYFTHQCLEKIWKAQLLRHRIITPKQLKKVGHNLQLGLAQYWKWDKLLWEEHKKIRSNPKFQHIFNGETDESLKDNDPFQKIDVDKIIRTRETQIKELETKKDWKPQAPEDTVKRMDDAYVEFCKSYENNKKNHEKLMTMYKEKLATAPMEEAEKERKHAEMTNNFEQYIIGGILDTYTHDVIREVVFVLPNQDELRYPESNPLETYIETHPLVMNLGEIQTHLKRATEFMLRLDFSRWKENDPLLQETWGGINFLEEKITREKDSVK